MIIFAMLCVTLAHVTVPSSAMQNIIIISAPVMSVNMLRVDSECRYVICRHAERHSAKCHC